MIMIKKPAILLHTQLSNFNGSFVNNKQCRFFKAINNLIRIGICKQK